MNNWEQKQKHTKKFKKKVGRTQSEK